MNAADLHQLARLLREVATAATADPGEPRVPHGVLSVVEDVARHPGASVSEIAERTGLAQSLVSKVVAEMKEGEIFIVEPDESDRRRIRVTIAEEARSGILRERGARPIAAALEAIRPGLPEARREQAEKLLERLAQLLLRDSTG